MLIALLVFLPMAAAPVLYALGRQDGERRDRIAALLCGLECLLSLSILPGGASLDLPGVLGGGLSFTVDGFRAAYSLITSLLWLGTTLFAREYFREERRGLDAYWMFTFLTLGATQGVMLSADFLTTFVFFETLSMTSVPWVLHERDEEAVYAGYTYLFIAVGGGLTLLMGLLMLDRACGTLNYAQLRALVPAVGEETLLPAGLCILLGFGAKAGMFPLHVWLPMAHPVAPAPASALLSGLLTKVGVFGVLMTCTEVLYDSAAFGGTVLLLGLVTMVLGAALALFSVNLKRTLACSSMSQIGFILTGLGSLVLARAWGSEGAAVLAFSGAVLHMANHSILKLVLFLCAGAAAMNTHCLDLNGLRGWGRNKKGLKLAFALGGLGISGVPLLNGYLSKTLLHEGLVHLRGAADAPVSLLHAAEWVFLLSGGFTFAYMLKLFLCLFVEKNADPARQAAFDGSAYWGTRLSRGVVITAALALLPMGQPWLMTRLASYMTGTPLSFAAFSWENLQGGFLSLALGGVTYLAFVRPVLMPGGLCVNRWPAALDLERNVYRPLFTRILPGLLSVPVRLMAENRVLGPLCLALRNGILDLFQERRNPFSGVLTFAAWVLSQGLADSADLLVMFLRRTVFREAPVRNGPLRVSRWRAFVKATQAAMAPVLENFTFSLLMTCGGILIFLTLLMVAML